MDDAAASWTNGGRVYIMRVCVGACGRVHTRACTRTKRPRIDVRWSARPGERAKPPVYIPPAQIYERKEMCIQPGGGGLPCPRVSSCARARGFVGGQAWLDFNESSSESQTERAFGYFNVPGADTSSVEELRGYVFFCLRAGRHFLMDLWKRRGNLASILIG